MEYKEYIAEIGTKIGILDVIGHYVKLRKQGRNYVGLCPFHHEKTPSFTISPDKDMFYCFGCKASGDMLTFVRKVHNVSLPEAIEIVSKEFHVELPPWHMSTAASRERQELLQTLKLVATAFAAALQSPQAGECQEYVRSRGLSFETVRHFSLGYCPRNTESLVKWCSEHGIDEDSLARTGIVQRHEGHSFSPFSHRLMFPIWDSIGNVIAFGGRAIDGSMPKYTNSPETPLFAKRKTLYALPLAEPSIRETGTAVIVEGYMDAIALHAAGFTNTVASLGTAFTEEQGTLLKRSASRVLLNFDSDEAGQRAARLALSIADRTGLDVAVVRVEGAKDPDELLREPEGKAQYQVALDQAISVGDFLLDTAVVGRDMSSVGGRRAFVQEMMESVDDMQDSLLRTQLLSQIALRVHVREEEVLAMYHKGRKRVEQPAVTDPWRLLHSRSLGHLGLPTGGSLQTARSVLEQEVVHGLIHNLDRLSELLSLLDGLSLQDEACQEILSVLRRETSGETALVPSLITQLGPEAAAMVSQWSLERRDLRWVEEHKLSYEGVRDTANRLRTGSSAVTQEDSSITHERGG
ncbi:MAG: DNA primase [Caldiserica bacterium]|nr:DNA primase [Caldisericota bacterium]